VRGLNTTKAKSVVVGGLSGLTLDVSVAPTWTRKCPGQSEPTVELFADANGREHDFQVHGDVPMRLFLLDLGDGRTLLIDIFAKDKATWDVLIPEAMPVIQTFQFNR
jgi:hypothetical protein